MNFAHSSQNLRRASHHDCPGNCGGPHPPVLAPVAGLARQSWNPWRASPGNPGTSGGPHQPTLAQMAGLIRPSGGPWGPRGTQSSPACPGTRGRARPAILTRGKPHPLVPAPVTGHARPSRHLCQASPAHKAPVADLTRPSQKLYRALPERPSTCGKPRQPFPGCVAGLIRLS
ncbi:putative cuticle collagen 155 [Macrobrachium nipponense]|uniref:putative cuticle collagen 155 n=1 Tax=Macrobrachium nipponense TaxID=159736 RepID=UPI0030C7C77D